MFSKATGLPIQPHELARAIRVMIEVTEDYMTQSAGVDVSEAKFWLQTSNELKRIAENIEKR